MEEKISFGSSDQLSVSCFDLSLLSSSELVSMKMKLCCSTVLVSHVLLLPGFSLFLASRQLRLEKLERTV